MLRTFLLFLALVITSLAWPQEYTRTLRSPATIKGFIGGESHDMYVIHAHQGQSMMVELSWKIEHDKEIGDNHADLDIGGLPGFTQAPELKSGRNRKRTIWSGKVPRTDDYQIVVTGYPSAHYMLKVKIQ
jgi:hypothetical protein